VKYNAVIVTGDEVHTECGLAPNPADPDRVSWQFEPDTDKVSIWIMAWEILALE